MISHRPVDAPGERKEGQIGFVEGPIPRGKRRRQHHFTKGRYEERAPKVSDNIPNVHVKQDIRTFDALEVARCGITGLRLPEEV